MPEVIAWPCSLTRPMDVSYFIQWTSRDAGANLAGVAQVLAPSMGAWRVDITIPRDFDGTRVKELEALVSEMRGRYNVANLCICDPYKYGPRVSPVQTPFSDGTWFSDGTGFTDPAAGTQPLLTSAVVAAGDNELYVDLTNPVRPSLRIGDMFSVNGFLYRVVRRNSAGWVKFEPSARRPIAAGTALTTNPPRFFGRFVDDMQGQRTREMLKWGQSITISFIEAFDR
ncbi:hypothetical protein BDE18_0414 [Paracoccus pantotrophus]|uniref:Uncharacterized protein n=1 Tax=Paracoccus pantotrophus TaxID=82367 RepID=A0AAE6NXI2_PARPN|nr:hypothetical protein [Paracoccus pantotrophus]QFG38299.1 hypothetical protein ESD82_19940 [Paracoccus pantotrophus]RKS51183.1 hypothetical protein BDE18_0414 [Paracoccus pantotrophus]